MGGGGKTASLTLSRSTSLTEQTLVNPKEDRFKLPPHKVKPA